MERIKINGIQIKQPLKGLKYGFTKRYSGDSTYVQSGREYTTTIGTYEQFTYAAANLTAEELSTILGHIIGGEVFTLRYMSPYYGAWRDGLFRVESGEVAIGRWKETEEMYESLSFTMTGVESIA